MKRVAVMFSLFSTFMSLILIFGIQNPVAASEVRDFFDALKADAAKNGGTFEYQSLEEDGNTATLKGLNFQSGSGDGKGTVETLVLKNAKKVGEDGFSFDQLDAQNLKIVSTFKSGSDYTISIGSATAESLDYPGPQEDTTLFWLLSLANGDLQDIRIETIRSDESAVLQIPAIQVAGLRRGAGDQFELELVKLNPSSGTFLQDGSDFAFSFDGLELNTLKYLGGPGISFANFEAGKFNLEGTTSVGDEIGVDLNGIAATNFYSPNIDEPDSPLFGTEPFSVEVGSAEVRLNGNRIAGWENAGGVNELTEDGTVISGEGSLRGMYVDLTQIPVTRENKQALDTLSELGYDQLHIDVSGKGSWNVTSGLVELDAYRFDLKDFASVVFSGALTGYTEDVARRISQLSNQSNLEQDPRKRQAVTMQLLGEMATLGLKQFALEIEDKDGLDRIVDLQTKRSRQDRQSVVAIVPFLATSFLTPLNVPTLADQIRTALTVFMEGNKTIRLSSEPENPIAFTQLLAIGAGARAGTVQPAEIVDRLNVKVEAE